MSEDKELEYAAHAYANKKKLGIGGIDVWALIEIFTDGANLQKERGRNEAIRFAEYLLSDFEMSEFTTAELHNLKLHPNCNLCWLLAGTNQKYTTEQVYEIYQQSKKVNYE